jgi:leader peptidase (prepilin peptidase)/N-methyltransferase
LLLVSCIDLEVGLIPNRFVLIIFIWVLLWQLFYPGLSPLSALLGFIVGAGLFFIIVLLSRGGMGGGDVKLMAVLGLAAGWPDVLIVMVLAFVLGAVTGAGLLISRKKTRRDALAFAPFLMLAFILVSFWGREIWQWYLVSM